MKTIIGVVLGLLVASSAFAYCSGYCDFTNHCVSGGSTTGWNCASVTYPDGSSFCEMYDCEEPFGGGGGRLPASVSPAELAKLDKASQRLKSIKTIEEMKAVCATIPGCTMTDQDGNILHKTPYTWGALKILYR